MTTGIVYSTFIDQNEDIGTDGDKGESMSNARESMSNGSRNDSDAHHDANGDGNDTGDYSSHDDDDDDVTRLHHREWFADEKNQVMVGMVACTATTETVTSSNGPNPSIHKPSSSSSSSSISSCLHAAVSFKRSHDPDLTPDMKILMKPMDLSITQKAVWLHEIKTYGMAGDGDGYYFSRPFNYVDTDHQYDHSHSNRDGDRDGDSHHQKQPWNIHSYHVDITLQSSIDENIIVPSTILCGVILCIKSPNNSDTGASTTEKTQLDDNLLICNAADRIFFLLSLGK